MTVQCKAVRQGYFAMRPGSRGFFRGGSWMGDGKQFKILKLEIDNQRCLYI